MYSKNAWLFDLHNIFKQLDGDTSVEAYRKLIDSVEFFDMLFDEGMSPQTAFEMYWSEGDQDE